MIEYKTYTTKDVCEWIEKGVKNGLSEHIISLTRANALVHCPCVKDDDVLVVSAKDGEKVVGYTAVIPEKLERPDIWIASGTTLWVNPDYADEFVGYNLVQRLWQAYPNYAVISSDEIPAAALIDKLLGASILKYDRHAFVINRKVEANSIRSLGSVILEPIRKHGQKKAINHVITSIPAQIRVVSRDMIDVETYEFIKTHSTYDTFLRSREMLNWILRYPFFVSNLLMNHAKKALVFDDQSERYINHLYQVYSEDTLVGVMILGVRKNDMHVKMLYMDNAYEDMIYALIVEFIKKMQVRLLYSIYPEFNKYIIANHIGLRDNKQQFLFSYPQSIKHWEPFVLQGIDGDMFV